tara:strand:+ start:1065 stop:1352 length:288 start_codon:yes stop_codon:yes gene_type:complete
MGALANHCYARISSNYYETHHERQSDAVVNGTVWVNNLTDLPCNESNGYCDNCEEFIITGYPVPSGDSYPDPMVWETRIAKNIKEIQRKFREDKS